MKSKYKIAWLSPLLPLKTGIAHYSSVTSSHLINEYDIDFFSSAYTFHPFLKTMVHAYDQFEEMFRNNRYSLIVYHMGNNATFHKEIYTLIQKYPGLVVLHDYSIHHMIAGLTIEQKDELLYLNEIEIQYGKSVRKTAWESLRGYRIPLWEMGIEYPLNKRVLSNALGVLVHSEYIKKIILKNNFKGIVEVIPHFAINSNITMTKDELRIIHSIPREDFVISTIGFVSRAKRISSILKALKIVLQENKNIRLYIIGEIVDDYDIHQEIIDLKLENFVTLTGYVKDEQIDEYIALSDLCINLRYPTQGESSGIVPRVLSQNRPIIVSNVGAFTDLPADIVDKISVDENEVNNLSSAIVRRIRYNNCNNEMIMEFVERELSLKSVSKKYIELIDRMINVNKYNYIMKSLAKEIPHDPSKRLLEQIIYNI